MYFPSRCIRAAMTRSAAWAATATALNRPPPAASTAAGRRSVAIETPCAAMGTAAVTVRAARSGFHLDFRVPCRYLISCLMQIFWKK